MAKRVVFFDTEVSVTTKRVLDYGAVNQEHACIHTAKFSDFCEFLADADYICGHNIINHDLKYLGASFNERVKGRPIDTLYLSPLLFPRRPYHNLLKDDKIQVESLNNPVNDSQKAATLFYDEVAAFMALPMTLRRIYCALLYEFDEFVGFFDYVECRPDDDNIEQLIRGEFEGLICASANLDILVKHYPRELAYSLALISTCDKYSLVPPWVSHSFPKIDNVLKFLCNTPCEERCNYCRAKFDVNLALKEYFGFDEFRRFDGEPLQENAARAAAEGKSLLAVFPTGGGKSIAFQVPALMAGRNAHGLTVVISPLQSLMKDQVDNLAERGIEDAVTINGLLDPIERANAIERVMSGKASLLYISPEMLRSRTVERMLDCRNVERFVIDEAHCFSAWGQDFRVDYLYIGDFIRSLQRRKLSDKKPIPVSCFTATAKQKVISDIKDYFKRKLNLDLELYASRSSRKNLHYAVIYRESDEEKYTTLRGLIVEKQCPTIVYVSRTRRTVEIARRLTMDGIKALPYNGKMESKDKIAHQEAFMSGEVSVIVATSAFGMGVDKSDVKLVVHYDISDSLENYVQEAGRAGRDPNLQADCYVLYNDSDLDKHFILLNQTKLSISEIQQVWRAVKSLTKNRPNICCSALEIAREAGWDDGAGSEIETRVRTALSSLETAGYIVRGRNTPKVYATSILAKNMEEAATRIRNSSSFNDNEKRDAIRIIKSLISCRSRDYAGNDEAESRVDYLADILGIKKDAVIQCVNLMRQEGILQDHNDMTAFLFSTDTERRSHAILERYLKLEQFLLAKITNGAGITFVLKELNEEAISSGITTSNVKNIRRILYFLSIRGYIQKIERREDKSVDLSPLFDKDIMLSKFDRRLEISRFILDYLYAESQKSQVVDEKSRMVTFSLVAIHKAYLERSKDVFMSGDVALGDVEEALLYLSKIEAITIEGGFLVLYNGMEIKRLVMDNKIQYKLDDYRLLDEFYKQRIRQIHIVGEYANLMVRDYDAALRFVSDYFNMDFKKFIAHYFEEKRIKEIERNITPDKYNQLFGGLSDVQSQVITDDKTKYIVVAAGPGSGKTRVLVHKLASLLLLEDVKHEQLLMLTFSRAAATEFKKRLRGLIGNAANYVEVKTFHSYCFDLMGKVGSLEGASDIVRDAGLMIKNNEVEPGKVIKSVLVIDEAQDMDEHEYALVSSLMSINESMRVIAVGDDDQNIYQFRGSDSKYLKDMIESRGAKKYEMTENYRSARRIVRFANSFVRKIEDRMKSAECAAVTDKQGSVRLTRYTSPNMAQALIEQLVKDNHHGKTSVLTEKNEDAFELMCLLNKAGKRAKLIQSIDGFKLFNLAEVRFFLSSIESLSNVPIIGDEQWKNAKSALNSHYGSSSCIDNVNRMIADFEAMYPNAKYKTDLVAFIYESNYEDFYDTENDGQIYVSTIHKSKGREFDNVYLMLKDTRSTTDEELRKIYVALTRAKNNLSIHTNTDIFNGCDMSEVSYAEDKGSYSQPAEIMLQTTHKDVYLGFFKGKKWITTTLRAGMQLKLNDVFITAELNGRDVNVAKCSKQLCATIERLENMGYTPDAAKLEFVVHWKGQDEDEETVVILTSILFRR